MAMTKMGKDLPLKHSLTKFLLSYRAAPHTATEMKPDELFLHRSVRMQLTLVQPNFGATVEKHQTAQKKAHDNMKPFPEYSEGASVMVRNQQGKQKWLPGCILKQKGYLLRVGSRV